MRSVVGFVVLAVAAGSVIAVSGPALASPVTPATGTYVGLDSQSRVVDTRTGTAGNTKGRLGAGRTLTATIAGRGSVPATGVGSVMITLTAVGPTGSGTLVAYQAGTSRPRATTVSFAKGERAVTDTTIVPLDNQGRIGVTNTAPSGSVDVTVDVSGYYAGGTAVTEPGAYHPVTPGRIVDTRYGTAGNHKGALAPGHGIRASVGGKLGLPATPGEAAVQITALSPAKAGTLIAYRPDEPKQSYAVLHFGAKQTRTAFATLRLANGKVDIVNTSGAAVHIQVDVLGWYDLGFAEKPGNFQSRVTTRQSTVTVAPNGYYWGNANQVGVYKPTAVLVRIHVVSPTASGSIRVYRSGTSRPTTTGVVQFTGGRTTANEVLIPVNADGRFGLANVSRTPVRLVLDYDGFVASTAVPPPAQQGVARYLNKLTGDSEDDPVTMSKYGKADALAGAGFVLLDVGAQTITGLAPGQRGVALANSSSGVRLLNDSLVDDVTAYLTAFDHAAPGSTATIAVGTSNDGAWDPRKPNYYAPYRRGIDWAEQVVNPLDTHAKTLGLKVVGANDIEPAFASTVNQALSWEKNFLGRVNVQSNDALVFNGSADGCPKTYTPATTCGFGWTQDHLVALSSGQRIVALPQIYLGYHATQWASINATSKRHVGQPLRFLGILTEYQLDDQTLTVAQAASALDVGLLGWGGRTSDLPRFSVDFVAIP